MKMAKMIVMALAVVGSSCAFAHCRGGWGGHHGGWGGHHGFHGGYHHHHHGWGWGVGGFAAGLVTGSLINRAYYGGGYYPYSYGYSAPAVYTAPVVAPAPVVVQPAVVYRSW